jgi:hypothetical protein
MCFTAFSSLGICTPNWRISSGLPPVSAKGKIHMFFKLLHRNMEDKRKDNLWAASNIYINKPVLRIRIHSIHMFLGLPDPDPLVRGIDPDPDPSIIMQK